MATNHTENYELNQWLATDQVVRTDFNADNAKIDTALAALAVVRLETGSYTGSGNTSSKTLTLDHTPVFVVVGSTASSDLLFLFQGAEHAVSILADNPSRSVVYRMNSVWSGNSVTWSAYYTGTDQNCFMDESGVTYRYIAVVSD